jgi:heptosyltransferase II
MSDKILVVGPSWVGDMVMAQALFKIVKLNNPHAEIDVLAPAWSLPILARMPEVSSSIIMPLGHSQLGLRERFRIGKQLREKQYTQAIVLPNSFKSALIPFFAKIPKRTGWKRELRSFILNDTRRLNKKRYPLMIEQYMALGVAAGASLPSVYPLPELKVLPQAQSQTLTKYQLNIAGRSILALCPGAEFGPAKRWPEQYYAEVANQKLKEGWDVWIFGSPKDMPVAEAIMQLTQHRCINFAGKTKLEEAVDLLALASAVVSNDSGLMHIAAALNKPLVAVYGPTSAGFTPPLNKDAKVLTLKLECQPCFQRECPLKHHRCMQELTPQLVMAALQQAAKDGSQRVF